MAGLGSLCAPVLLLASFACSAFAGSFLQARAHTEKAVSSDSVQQAFASALVMDVRSFEEELRPMVTALPKNPRGALEPSVVRYALHRYFLHKHGWYVKGMQQPARNSSDASSSAGVLKDHVPEYVQGLMQERMKSEDWRLHELALCAAAISQLIQEEVMADLRFVYSTVLHFSTTSDLSEGEYGRVVEMYLAQYILDENWDDWQYPSIMKGVRAFYQRHHQAVSVGWGDLQMWAADVRRSMDYAESDRRNPFARGKVPFARVAAVVQEIMHRYSSFQSVECDALTNTLAEMAWKGSGRVPLSTFYTAGQHSRWNFRQPVEYLRHIGALDESNPRRPSVVIPNYVYSSNNCLASSSFFSVCCTNKCERLMSHVEREIGAPIASPQRLAEVVAALSSDFVDAPRQLPAHMLMRLRKIGDLHNGEVPLHSRLFAQWMHHVYPQECAFPHSARGESTLTPEDWSAQTGLEHSLDRAELAQHAVKSGDGGRASEILPWSDHQELVSFHWEGFLAEAEGSSAGPNMSAERGAHSPWRKWMALLVLASLVVPQMRAWSAALGTAGPKVLEKQMV